MSPLHADTPFRRKGHQQHDGDLLEQMHKSIKSRGYASVKTKMAKGHAAVAMVETGEVESEDKEGNESRPDYAGPVEDYATKKNMRIAGWKRSKDGNNFMSLQISEKIGKQGGEIPFDDKIPF